MRFAVHGFVLVMLMLRVCERRWFSGKISRCQRDAPGSIPGRRIPMQLSLLLVLLGVKVLVRKLQHPGVINKVVYLLRC